VRPADRVADVRVQLDDRSEELGLEPPRQLELLRLADQQLNRGRERQRLGVEDHHFLLDPTENAELVPNLCSIKSRRLNVPRTRPNELSLEIERFAGPGA
jgi:hypothetical protein